MSGNIDVKTIWASLKKQGSVALKHVAFAVIIFILLAYLFMVWRISQLAIAEPSPEDASAALTDTHVPKIDKNAIKQIEQLEQSNTEIKSLFDAARTNPFSE